MLFLFLKNAIFQLGFPPGFTEHPVSSLPCWDLFSWMTFYYGHNNYQYLRMQLGPCRFMDRKMTHQKLQPPPSYSHHLTHNQSLIPRIISITKTPKNHEWGQAMIICNWLRILFVKKCLVKRVVSLYNGFKKRFLVIQIHLSPKGKFYLIYDRPMSPVR